MTSAPGEFAIRDGSPLPPPNQATPVAGQLGRCLPWRKGRKDQKKDSKKKRKQSRRACTPSPVSLPARLGQGCVVQVGVRGAREAPPTAQRIISYSVASQKLGGPRKPGPKPAFLAGTVLARARSPVSSQRDKRREENFFFTLAYSCPSGGGGWFSRIVADVSNKSAGRWRSGRGRESLRRTRGGTAYLVPRLTSEKVPPGWTDALVPPRHLLSLSPGLSSSALRAVLHAQKRCLFPEQIIHEEATSSTCDMYHL